MMLQAYSITRSAMHMNLRGIQAEDICSAYHFLPSYAIIQQYTFCTH